MTDIALGKVLETAVLREFFASLFPGLVVRVGDSWDDVETPFDVVVILHPNDSEFPCGLGVVAKMREGRDFEAWLRGLARALGEHFGTPAFCDGSPYGDTPSPYWALVWDQGQAFLGCDLETTLGDGEGGPVRIVRKLDPAPSDNPAAAELKAWIHDRDHG